MVYLFSMCVPFIFTAWSFFVLFLYDWLKLVRECIDIYSNSSFVLVVKLVK